MMIQTVTRGLQFGTLIASVLAVLVSCGGGSGGRLGALPVASLAPGPVTKATISVPVSQTGVPIALPALPGISGTVTLPSSSASAGTMLSITTDASLPPFVSGAPEPGSVVFLTITLTSSQDVTFHGLPLFSVTLSSPPADQGAFFAWQFAQTRWTNYAPLLVVANTLTFGGETQSISLLKNTPTVIVPLTASSSASCPTPFPSPSGPPPSGSPLPSPSPTPTPVPTPVGNPMYLASDFLISVFPATADGNVAPSRRIVSDGIAQAGQIALDAQHELYVTNSERFLELPVTGVTVFSPNASGNASPIRWIFGGFDPSDDVTDLVFPDGIAVDAAGTAFVVDENGTGPSAAINVYAPGATGNVAPIRRVVGDQTGLGPASLEKGHNIALDATRGMMYVANTKLNTVTAYPIDANGNVAPARTISGSATGLNAPFGVAVDPSGNIYVSSSGSNQIEVFAPSADGNATPLRTIAGANTGLVMPEAITLDSLGELYVVDRRVSEVTVYAPGAAGNASPIRILGGSRTELSFLDGIAVDR